ncbi:riboflavin biosynthesis protein RibD [Sulfoacidibacillus thermotolerans]|uniref:Riboflavin biosynthesis protein RibD n=2 Tax=Sulfoacidibacillus thermotolerans TaxID=1765684 RepID=A0A2U3D5R4_SULT2|nr:riboflavin biosynthesis protein RibD [Sulfoacidibacillus thermotolerans]
MRMALQLAAVARGRTSPNPMVGAVLVKEGRIIGFGAHLQAGKPHAEIHALQMAGEDAAGSTLYVTLEPCAHYGKTPPCANALVQARIRRAVIAMKDPFPLVAGKGIEILRHAGILVEVGLLAEEAQALNRNFLHYVEKKRPFVTLKLAASLDGWIATKEKQPLALTSYEALVETHRLRNEVDGIIVGVNTILSDDPQLTVRMVENGRNPVRFIFDRHLRIPLHAKVVTDGQAHTVVFCGPDADALRAAHLVDAGVEVVRLLHTDSLAMIHEALTHMGENGARHVMLEGGSTLAYAFLGARAIDEVWLFHAPKLLMTGWPAFVKGDPETTSVLPLVLENITRRSVGVDELTIGTPVWNNP